MNWSRSECFAVLGLALLAAVFLLSQKLQPSDDAYITFRHARNLAIHFRPAWNLEGAPVMGSSSPAFVFLLGALGFVFGPDRMELLVLCLDAALLAVVVVLTHLVMRDLVAHTGAALTVAFLVGFNSVNVFVFSQGFEAALFVAVLLGGLYAVRRGWDAWAVVLASGAPLVRPEGVLLLLLVWGFLFLRRRVPWRLVGVFLLAPLVWCSFAIVYYGSIVPHPVRAKKFFPAIYHPYQGGEVDLSARLWSIGSHTTEFWRNEASSYLFGGFRFPRHSRWGDKAPLRWSALALPFLLAFVLLRHDGRVVYLLYAPMFVILFGWIGRQEVWYFPSFVTLSIVLLFYACWIFVEGAWRFLNYWTDARFLSRRLWRATATFALLCLFLTPNQYALNREGDATKGLVYALDPRGPSWNRFEQERYRAYRRAAVILNREAGPTERALVSEVGVFGFFFRGDVIDAVGLCSPEALAFYPPPPSDIWGPDGEPLTAANNLVPTAMVMSLRPTYVINAKRYIENLLRPGSPFPEHYSRIAEVGWAWGSPVLVFKRLEQFGSSRFDPPAHRSRVDSEHRSRGLLDSVPLAKSS